MRKTFLWLNALMILFGLGFVSCDEKNTYGDLVEQERKMVQKFLHKDIIEIDANNGDTLFIKKPIKVIDEETFKRQGYTTNLPQNEYVYFNHSGIYMQIIREGVGEKIENGETATLLCRFLEYNIEGDSLFLSNVHATELSRLDYLQVSKQNGDFSGTFLQGTMAQIYGNYVPSGWLLPLLYIKVGRPNEPNESIAKVRVILPHGQGHKKASELVKPTFYEITYQKTRI